MVIKKRMLLGVSALFSMLLLSGCGPMYQTHYSYIPPQSSNGRQCINQCLTNRSYCQSQCQTNYQSCKTSAELIAMPQYLSYVHQQNAANQPITQGVGDFADYSSCTTQCGCEATYRSCFVNCGGSVIANTQCVAFCNQK